MPIKKLALANYADGLYVHAERGNSEVDQRRRPG